MAKGPIVTNDIEVLIASVHRKYPKWKAREVRNEVSSILHKNNPKLDQKWPGLHVVQKVLAVVRKQEKERPINPQDAPWSTAALDSYPRLNIELPTPEALALVLKVWKSRIEKGDTFTISEAKWASRLSGLISDIEKLSFAAFRHARTELMYELIGRNFDSTVLDRLLMHLPTGLTSDRDSWLPFIAEQEDGVDQVRNLKKNKGVFQLVGDAGDKERMIKIVTGKYIEADKKGGKSK